MRKMSRRDVLRAGVAAGALAAAVPALQAEAITPAAAGGNRRSLRPPNALPDPSRPMGTPDESMPFENIICWMMENHSFDNYFGMLSRRGQPLADGFKFDKSGNPVNHNFDSNGNKIQAFKLSGGCAGNGISQSWDVTHESIYGEPGVANMQGFVTAVDDDQPMAYWEQDTLPFYYSLANTFTLANRWFCSAPCQT
jgi:phospholipase C